MTITTWTDNEGNTYSKPYIPEKIVGLSGIDPDLVSEAGGGSGEGTQDHEKLGNLKGGIVNEHYHLDVHTYYHVVDTVKELFMKNGTPSAQTDFIGKVLRENTLNAIIDARIAAYLSNNNP